MGGVRWSFWLVKRGQGRAGLHPRPAPHVVVLAVGPRRSAVSASHWQPSPGRGAAGGLTVGTTGMRQHRHLPFGTGREVVRPCLRHPLPGLTGVLLPPASSIPEKGSTLPERSSGCLSPWDGAPLRGKPYISSSGTSCSRLGPKTTRYHCRQNFPSNRRVQDYVTPWWQLRGSLTDAASPSAISPAH